MEITTETTLEPQALAREARARAAFYGFLSAHFNTLPDEAFVGQVREPACTAMLQAVMDDDPADGDLAAGAVLMAAYLQATAGQPAAQLAEALGVDRTRLYRGITPAYGPPPPYEMVWSQTYQDVTLLSVLARLYREAGLTLAPETHERLDYAGVELDYLRELVTREAAEWEAGNPETALAQRAQQLDFLNAHLGAWAPAYVDRALPHARTDFYRGHLLMWRGFIAGERQGLALPAGTS